MSSRLSVPGTPSQPSTPRSAAGSSSSSTVVHTRSSSISSVAVQRLNGQQSGTASPASRSPAISSGSSSSTEGKGGFFNRLTEQAKGWLIKQGSHRYLGKLEKKNLTDLLETAYKEMQNTPAGPRYAQLIRFYVVPLFNQKIRQMCKSATPTNPSEIPGKECTKKTLDSSSSSSSAASEPNPIKTSLNSTIASIVIVNGKVDWKQVGLLQQVLDINIVYICTNLANKIRAFNEGENSTKPLEAIVSLLNSKLKDTLFEEIKNHYEKNQDKHRKHFEFIGCLYKEIERKIDKSTLDKPAFDEMLLKLIRRLREIKQKKGSTKNPGNDPEVKDILSPIKKILKLVSTEKIRQDLCDSISYEVEAEEIYENATSSLFRFLLPQEAQGIQAPGLDETVCNFDSLEKKVKEIIYNLIKNSITFLLRENYEQLQVHPNQIDKWHGVINAYLPGTRLAELAKMPKALLIGLARQSVGSETMAEYVEKQLEQASPLPSLKSADYNYELFARGELKEWIIEGIKAISETKDEKLKALAESIGEFLEVIGIALLAKSTKFLPPHEEGENGAQSLSRSDQFLARLLEMMIRKIQAIQTGKEEIPVDFWTELLADLPLPEEIKPWVAKFIQGYVDQAQQLLKCSLPATDEITRLRCDAEKEVGDRIVALSKKITEFAFSKMVERGNPLQLFAEQIQETVESFLPGFVLPPQLSEWFKGNLIRLFTPTMSSAQQDSASSASAEEPKVDAMQILKDSFYTLILTGIRETIKNNFQGSVENYAAKFLNHIHEACKTSLSSLTAEEKGHLILALEIQKEMDEIIIRLEVAKTEAAKAFGQRKDPLAEPQQSLVTEIVRINIQIKKIELECEKLISDKGSKKPKIEGTEIPLDALQQALNYEQLRQNDILVALKREKHLSKKELIESWHCDKQAENIRNHITESNEEKNLKTLSAFLSLDDDQQKQLYEVLKIERQLKNKVVEKDHLLQKLRELQLSDKFLPELAILIEKSNTIKELELEIEQTQQKLDGHLTAFQTLSKKLMQLFGLEGIEDRFKEIQEKCGNDGAECKQIPMKEEGGDAELPSDSPERSVRASTTAPVSLLSPSDPASPVRESSESRQATHSIQDETGSQEPSVVGSSTTAPALLPSSNSTSSAAASAVSESTQSIKKPSPTIQDRIKNYFAKKVLSFKEIQVPLILLREIAPILRLQLKQEEDKAALKTLAGSDLWNNLAQAIAKQAMTQLPALLPQIKAWVDEFEVKVPGIMKAAYEMLAPQVEAIFVGADDATVQKERKVVEEFIEGLIQHYLVNLLTAQPEKNLLAMLKAKLSGLKVDVSGKSEEECEKIFEEQTNKLLDEIVTDLIQVTENLKECPPFFRQMLLDTLKQLLHPQKEINDELKNHLQAIFFELAGPSLAYPSQKMAQEVLNLIQAAPHLSLNVSTMIEIFLKVAPQKWTSAQKDEKLKSLREKYKVTGNEAPLFNGKKGKEFLQVKPNLHTHLEPLIRPVIEREYNRQLINATSGSETLAGLASIAYDAFRILPFAFDSYRAQAIKIFTGLAGQPPNEIEAEAFTQGILKLVENGPKKQITNKAILKVYLEVTEEKVSEERRAALHEQLRKNFAVANLESILVTPEKIIESISTVQDLNDEFKIELKAIFFMLAGIYPSDYQAQQMAQEVLILIQAAPTSGLKVSTLMDVFLKVAPQEWTRAQKEEKLSQLREKNQVKGNEDLLFGEHKGAGFLITKQRFSEELKSLLIGKLQIFTHQGGLHYANLSTVLGTFIEGILLRLLVKVAKKHPTIARKGPGEGHYDTPLILIKEIVGRLIIHIKQLEEEWAYDKSPEAFDKFADNLIFDLLTNVLGIESEKDLVGLPSVLQGELFQLIKREAKTFILSFEPAIRLLHKNDAKIKELQEKQLKRFGTDLESGKAYLHTLAEDLGRLISYQLPVDMAEKINMGEGKKAIHRKGTNILSKLVSSLLDGYAKSGYQAARVLLDYSNTKALQCTSDRWLKEFAEEKAAEREKKALSGYMANLMLEPFHQIFSHIFDSQKEDREAFTQDLMVDMLDLTADHLDICHMSDSVEKVKGNNNSHQAICEIADRQGMPLHPAVPRKPISYDTSIKEIMARLGIDNDPNENIICETLRTILRRMVANDKNYVKPLTIPELIEELSNAKDEDDNPLFIIDDETRKRLLETSNIDLKAVILSEGAALVDQRLKQLYNRAAKAFMDKFFPNGNEDLIFVPLPLRGLAWKQLRTNLLPMMLQKLVELLLDKNTVTRMVDKGLETMRDVFKGDPGDAKADIPHEQLARAGGRFVSALMRGMELPKINIPFSGDLMAKFLDEDGNLNEKMAGFLGIALKKQFDEKFLNKNITSLLGVVTARGPDGTPVISMDTRPYQQRVTSSEEELKKLDQKVKETGREAIDASWFYNLRVIWDTIRFAVTEKVKIIFGEWGVKVANVLLDLFAFFHFKVVGRALLWLISPMMERLKGIMYESTHFENNVGLFLHRVRERLKGEPEEDKNYPTHLEGLAFNALEVILDPEAPEEISAPVAS